MCFLCILSRKAWITSLCSLLWSVRFQSHSRCNTHIVKNSWHDSNGTEKYIETVLRNVTLSFLSPLARSLSLLYLFPLCNKSKLIECLSLHTCDIILNKTITHLGLAPESCRWEKLRKRSTKYIDFWRKTTNYKFPR